MTRSSPPSWSDLNRQIRGLEKELGITHDNHSDLVNSVTGKPSLKGAPIKVMMKVRNELLNRRAQAHGGYQTSTKGHVRKLFALWGALKKSGHVNGNTRKGLMEFVNKYGGKEYTKPDQLNWLTADEAQPIIERLKAWVKKPAQQSVAEDLEKTNNQSKGHAHG